MLFSIQKHHHPESIIAGQPINEDVILRFVKDINLSLDQQNRSLSSTFTGITTETTKSLNITALSEHFNFMSFVPMYDFRTYSGNMALDMLNVTKMEQFLDNLIELCVPPSKIITGISLLGHSFTHKLDNIQFGDTFGSSHACEMAKKLKVANLFVKKSPQRNSVTHYSLESENVASIRRKVKFIKSRNLAGVTVFPVNFDDFLGKCDKNHTRNAFEDQENTYPFLRAINKEILDAFLQTHETDVDKLE